jgi:hypothetical protein
MRNPIYSSLTTLLGTCGETRQQGLSSSRQRSTATRCRRAFPETQVMLDALQPFTPPNKPVSIKSLHPTTRSFQEMGRKHLHFAIRKTPRTLQSTPLSGLLKNHRSPTHRRHHQSENQTIQLASHTDMYGIDGRGIVSVMIEKKPGYFTRKTSHHPSIRSTTGHSASYLVVAWSTMQNNRPSEMKVSGISPRALDRSSHSQDPLLRISHGSPELHSVLSTTTPRRATTVSCSSHYSSARNTAFLCRHAS